MYYKSITRIKFLWCFCTTAELPALLRINIPLFQLSGTRTTWNYNGDFWPDFPCLHFKTSGEIFISSNVQVPFKVSGWNHNPMETSDKIRHAYISSCHETIWTSKSLDGTLWRWPNFTPRFSQSRAGIFITEYFWVAIFISQSNSIQVSTRLAVEWVEKGKW